MRTCLKSQGHRVSFKPSVSSPDWSGTWDPCPGLSTATSRSAWTLYVVGLSQPGCSRHIPFFMPRSGPGKPMDNIPDIISGACEHVLYARGGGYLTYRMPIADVRKDIPEKWKTRESPGWHPWVSICIWYNCTRKDVRKPPDEHKKQDTPHCNQPRVNYVCCARQVQCCQSS